jgi:CubicO group peptidase (beta-lactamase class C family)
MRRTFTALTLATLIAPARGVAQVTPPRLGDDLLGLWGAEPFFGPAVRGAITLERGADHWTLRVGGLEATSRVAGDSVRIALPGGAGSFRARTAGAARELHGIWIQPAGNLPAYATPVRLQQMRPGAWRGTVTPLDDRMSLYNLFRRQPDGTVTGIFRNPEAGWNVGRTYRMGRDADNLTFSDVRTGKVQLSQNYDPGQRTIQYDFGQPFWLRPLVRDQARGFYPRTGAVGPYAYRAPLGAGDGWPTASGASVGLDESSLAAMVERIVQMDPASDSTALVHSVLVARRGKLVLEEYFYGYSADRLHDLRSASKTFTAIMAGVAMDRGARFTMSSPVYALLGRDSSVRADPRKGRITVGHLLTHSTGLACDDNADDSPGNEDTMQQQRTQPDWYRYMLDVGVAHDAGSVYAYCSGTMNLAGAVIARTTHSPLPEFFDEHLARPLGITQYAMNLMPSGDAYAGGGVHMRPRDLLKFGQLFLNGGTWNGVRVVSKEWADRSTAQQITFDGGADGYGWHLHTLHANGRDYREYEANGNGGQFLIVVPDLDLAVVFTAGNYGRYRIWRALRDEFVPKYLMAAIR